MTITIAAALAGLAVIDSTSIGTLVVPLWMLVHPQLRARMVVLYLAVIGHVVSLQKCRLLDLPAARLLMLDPAPMVCQLR